MSNTSFLLLQGCASPFFGMLADKLLDFGYPVLKLNFNCGDWAYWWTRKGDVSIRSGFVGLEDTLTSIYKEFEITDQVLFGDRRSIHQAAIRSATFAGVKTHVFEEGYFRPYWVTLEQEGVNAHSMLPKDPAWFRRAALQLPDVSDYVPFKSSFTTRALHDVAYHVAGSFNPYFFRGYRTHAKHNAALEYAGYIKRFLSIKLARQTDQALVEDWFAHGFSFFLLTLQLNSDAQIRDHSSFKDMHEVIRYVMTSFAKSSSSNQRLLIKNHPLDYGFSNYRKLVKNEARNLGLDGRVAFVDSGDLIRLIDVARGLVTVNSTSGTLALERNCPVLNLSDSVYNLPGLTNQCSLDVFWQNPQLPDQALFVDFKKVVMHTTQINGGFYCKKGMALAVDNAVARLTAKHSLLSRLMELTRS